mmetsp:Transcript_11258/g.17041  ORF Transcript_11258/g.17041 Transcript_11258/m.17041 type:complete len:86 (-) Transcript_11258:398-655(-)
MVMIMEVEVVDSGDGDSNNNGKVFVINVFVYCEDHHCQEVKVETYTSCVHVCMYACSDSSLHSSKSIILPFLTFANHLFSETGPV